MTDRPRGGRRPEEFPEARHLDTLVLALLRTGPETRNDLADLAGTSRLKTRYALNRLRRAGLVEHVKKGNEGHGYWAVTETETETDDQ